MTLSLLFFFLFGSTAQAYAPVLEDAQIVEVVEIEQPAPVKTAQERSTKPLHERCAALRPVLEQYDWDVEIALAVANEESDCSTSAHNKEAHRRKDGSVICYGSFGEMQISCHDGDTRYDTERNVKIAYRKYQERGWRPWGVCTSGKADCDLY